MFFRRSCKSEIKIDRNVIFNNQVLQNGCKYTQNSTTSFFSINFINLVNNFTYFGEIGHFYECRFYESSGIALHCRFDEISLNKVSNNVYKYPQNSSTSFSTIFIALSANFNIRCHGCKYLNFVIVIVIGGGIALSIGRFDEISSTSFSNNFISLSIGRLNKVSNNVNYKKKVLQNGYKYPRFNFNTALPIGRLNKVSNNVNYEKKVLQNGYKYPPFTLVSFIALSVNFNFNIRCHGRSGGGLFTKSFTKTFVFVFVLCFTGKTFVFVYMFDVVMVMLRKVLRNVYKFHVCCHGRFDTISFDKETHNTRFVFMFDVCGFGCTFALSTKVSAKDGRKLPQDKGKKFITVVFVIVLGPRSLYSFFYLQIVYKIVSVHFVV